MTDRSIVIEIRNDRFAMKVGQSLMVEDKILIWRFKHGSREALQRIYEKYVVYLVTLASALLNDVSTAEDIVHDVLVSFAQSGERLRLEGSLKAYLATCVVNRVRDKVRSRQRQPLALDEAQSICSKASGPELSAVCSEELQQLSRAIAQLPYEQREVVMLHVHGGMMFKHIAKSQQVSTNTVQSRYRYALDKLRSLMNGEMRE
jgi:RNA polymerase sigma factor (sigma-70 family)